MQSRLTSLLMLTTRQQCLFLCDIFFRRICMRICYVHFCCQPTPQLQNYSSPWMITYQENWTGRFLSVYAQTEWLPWLDGFLVSLLGSKRSLLNVSLCTVSSIGKCWLTEKCHLNLTTFCRIIKIINHIKVHALNSCLFAQLCEEMDTKHTRLLLYTEVRWLSKGRSLARVFELRELLQRFLLEKQSPLAAHSSDRLCRKTCLLVWHIQPAQQTQSVITSGENDSWVQVGT